MFYYQYMSKNNTIETVTRLEWRPMTEKDMIDKFEVDIDRRQIDNMQTSVHEWQQKDIEWNPVIISMYRTFAKWKRKFPEQAEYSIQAFENVLKQKWYDKVFKEIKHPKTNDLMATLDMFDMHINKRDKYNTPITKKLLWYDKQVWVLTNRIKLFNVKKLIMVLWGDLLETDHKGKTTSGTIVDAMVDEKDAYVEAQEWIIRTVERLRKDFQVELYFVLWNHDHNVLFYLSKVLEMAYRNTEVVVHTGQDRHYIDFGKVAIQLLHGDEKNPLPIMVNEFLMQSKKSYDHIYSKSWHTHKQQLVMNWPLQSRTHQSPSKRNKWADKYWYDPKPWMQASVYDKNAGEIAVFTDNW